MCDVTYFAYHGGNIIWTKNIYVRRKIMSSHGKYNNTKARVYTT